MKEFLQDKDGKLSSTRLVFLIWSIVLLVIWSVVSLKKTEIAGIPWEMILLIATFMSGKVVQTFREFKGINN